MDTPEQFTPEQSPPEQITPMQITPDEEFVINPTLDTPVQVLVNGTYVDMHKREITTEKLYDIVKSLEGSYDFIEGDMSYNDICDNAAEIIGKLLENNFTKATVIDMGNNKLGPKVAKILAEVLPKCEQLEYIYLDYNEFGPDDKECIRMACPTVDIIF